jgi:methylenetetrahydrofolate/methylenetetrahydromethanopterin dehydrogenase (NADP+)
MKKLLLQIDTDALPAAFDTVVAYDGGVDEVMAYGGITPDNVGALVEGAVFTRAPKDKKFTAMFVGGSNLALGEQLFKAIQKKFFSNFRVSVMLDSNGANTTAAALVACLLKSAGGSLNGQRAVVLAGTGPVGQRAAVMLAKEGASVSITSRTLANAQKTCDHLAAQFAVAATAIEAADCDARAAACTGAHIVVSAGAAGAVLLRLGDWKSNATIRLLADANATPPSGIEGVDTMDRGVDREGKACWGAIGFGALKLAVHRACIAQLFEASDQVLDAELIFAKAKLMATAAPTTATAS